MVKSENFRLWKRLLQRDDPLVIIPSRDFAGVRFFRKSRGLYYEAGSGLIQETSELTLVFQCYKGGLLLTVVYSYITYAADLNRSRAGFYQD